MSESLTLERARRYIAHLDSGGDPEDLDAFLADDFVQVEFPNQLTPGGATRDLRETKEARARGQALLSAESLKIVSAIPTSNQVAMELDWTGTVRETAGPFAAGQVLHARFAVFLTFRDGQIVKQHNYDCFDAW